MNSYDVVENTTNPRKSLEVATTGAGIVARMPIEETYKIRRDARAKAVREVVRGRMVQTHDEHGVPYSFGNRQIRRMTLRGGGKEKRQYHKQGHKGY